MTEHVWYKCPDDCEGCQYCLGGLAYCVNCRKGESELNDICPVAQEKDEVRDAACLDAGCDIDGKEPHKPHCDNAAQEKDDD